nr:hypothetical protein [Kribbella catacumbae]
MTLADGVNIKELAEYLGHGDPGFTLRLYTHMLPSSHERARKAVDSRLARLLSLRSHGAVTEQAAVRSPTASWEPDGGLSAENPKSASDLQKYPQLRPLSSWRAMTIRWTWLVPS